MSSQEVVDEDQLPQELFADCLAALGYRDVFPFTGDEISAQEIEQIKSRVAGNVDQVQTYVSYQPDLGGDLYLSSCGDILEGTVFLKYYGIDPTRMVKYNERLIKEGYQNADGELGPRSFAPFLFGGRQFWGFRPVSITYEAENYNGLYFLDQAIEISMLSNIAK